MVRVRHSCGGGAWRWRPLGVAAAAVVLCGAVTQPVAGLSGDANCSGAVSAADLGSTISALFEPDPCADADVNGDGAKRVSDVTAELQLLAAPSDESAFDQVADQIRPDGTIALGTARLLFQLAYGGLDGVTTPPAALAGDIEGTLALHAMLEHRDELSSADAARLDAIVDANGAVSTSIEPASTPLLAGSASPAARRAPAADEVLSNLLPADGPDVQDFMNRVGVWLPEIADQAAVPFTLRIDIAGYALRYPAGCDQAQGAGCEIADTLAFDANNDPLGGEPVRCRIRFFQNYIDKAGPQRDDTVAHELWHCFEAQIIDDCQAFDTESKWIIEGEAEYVGVKVTKTRSGSFSKFLSLPSVPLFARAYSAVGFYVTMENDGTDIFPALSDILLSGTASNELAFDIGALGSTPRLLDTWGERELEVTSHGGDWDYLIATGLPPPASDDIPGAVHLDIDDGSLELVQVPPYSVFLWKVNLATDFIHFQIHGAARVLDAAGNEFNDLSDLWLCAHGDSDQCKCPMGSLGMAPPSQPVSGLMMVAASAGDDPIDGTMTGMSLEQICKQMPTPTPTPSPFCDDARGLQNAIAAYAGQDLDPGTLQALLEADVYWLGLMAKDAPAEIAADMQAVDAAYVTANDDFASIDYAIVPMSESDEMMIEAALKAVTDVSAQSQAVGAYVARVCGFQFSINGI